MRTLKRCRPLLAAAILAILLTACAQRVAQPIPVSDSSSQQLLDLNNPSAFLAPGGDMHLVSVRLRGKFPIMCSEPSPDWATALATADQLTASGSAPQGPSASLSGSFNSAQTLTQLAGRTAGVVALRDGLYSACLFYGDGALGDDAISIILSQYGDLLVALAGSGGAAADGGSAPKTTTASGAPAATPIAISVSSGAAPASPPSPPGAPGAGGTAGSGASAQLALLQQEPLQVLLVSCINHYDPTRLGYATTPTDQVLSQSVCTKLINNVVDAAPALLTPQQQNNSGAGNNKSTPSAKANPKILAWQKALKAAGCDPGKLDGIDGTKTEAAARLCQIAKPA